MFEAIADTLRHPLLERERRRWSRRLSAWPKAALGLIGFVAALHGASLAARAAGWTTSPLPPAALDAAARAMIAGALATAMLAPVAVASWQLTPWLRSAEFEELLGTTASRSGIARALWALAWARCAAWTAGVQILSASFAFVAFDSAAAWNLAAKEAMRAAALLPALGVSASMAVHLGLERRNAGAVLWRALVWQAILFPLVGLLLAAVFVMGLLVIVAPLIAVVAHILSIFAGRESMSILGALILGLGAAFVAMAGAAIASFNLARAEAWCVPRDWLDSSYRWGRGAGAEGDRAASIEQAGAARDLEAAERAAMRTRWADRFRDRRR